MNPSEIWVGEYSARQGTCHLSTLEESIENNLQTILSGTPSGFLIVSASNSQDSAGRSLKRVLRILEPERQGLEGAPEQAAKEGRLPLGRS